MSRLVRETSSSSFSLPLFWSFSPCIFSCAYNQKEILLVSECYSVKEAVTFPLFWTFYQGVKRYRKIKVVQWLGAREKPVLII